MNVKLKKLACSALISAAAVLAAPAAHADFISFENVSNVVTATLGANDTSYFGGDRFNDSGFTMTLSDSAFAQSQGQFGGSVGVLMDGSNPSSCTATACPSGNLSNFYGALNDSSIAIARQGGAGFFSVASLAFSFLGPVLGLPDGIYGQLRLTGLTTEGSTVTVSRDFPSQDGNGNFAFGTWSLDPDFAALNLTSLSIDACLFDGNGNCFNDANNPAGNQAQFAIDDLQVEVPVPATAPLMLLGMAGLAFIRRRRAP